MIEDVNDNKPTLPAGELVICEKEGERGSTVVVAEDKDSGHYSSPFSFNLPPDHDGKWALESLNGRWWQVSAQTAGTFLLSTGNETAQSRTEQSGFIIQLWRRRCF